MNRSKLIVWNTSAEIPICCLEEEHRNLIEKLNQILLKARAQDFRFQDALKQELNQLMIDIIAHFEVEEALMKEISYQDRDAHIQAHEQFKQKSFEMYLVHEKSGGGGHRRPSQLPVDLGYQPHGKLRF